MVRKVSTLLSISLIFFIVGCFEYDEELVLNRDGSGTLLVHYTKMKDMDINDDNFNLPDDEDEIRSEIEKKWTSNKVTLVSFKVRDKEESQDVTFALKFKDVEDLNEVKQFADSEIEFHRGKKCRYQRIISTDSDWDLDEGSTFEKVLGSIIEETLLEKIKFRFEVKMPRTIDKSNAKWVRDEQNAVWRFTATDLIQGGIKMVVSCR